MKISKNQKFALALALLVPMVMYADGTPATTIAAVDTASNLITGTLKGTGKGLIYALEGVFGAYTYFQTRNWVSLTGIGAIMVFTTILFGLI